jgi:hypothetical protein
LRLVSLRKTRTVLSWSVCKSSKVQKRMDAVWRGYAAIFSDLFQFGREVGQTAIHDLMPGSTHRPGGFD